MQMIQALLFLLALISPTVPIEAQVETPFLSSRIGRGTIDSVQWHPDGSYIMITTVTGTWLYTPDLQDLAHIPAYFARMSPDGRYIAGVDEDALLHLWDAQTFELIENDEPWTIRQISLFKWSPDSRYIIVAGQMRDHDMTLIWYVAPTNQYSLYEGKFNEVIWSPDGRYLVRPSSTHIVVLKSGASAFESVIDYQPDFYFREEPTVIWDDETHLVITGGGPLNNIWINVETKEIEILPYTSTQLTHHLMNPAGTISLITGGDGFTLTNLENPAQSLRFPYEEDFSMVAWDHVGRFLAVGENTNSSRVADIRVIDLRTFDVIQHLVGL
jgi:WD40 repeat protein